jgi:hypothetical protein
VVKRPAHVVHWVNTRMSLAKVLANSAHQAGGQEMRAPNQTVIVSQCVVMVHTVLLALFLA